MNPLKTAINTLLRLGNYEVKKLNKIYDYVELRKNDKELVQEVINQNLTMTSPDRLLATLFAVKYVCNSKIDGDFVECGVWRGGNSILAIRLLNQLSNNKSVWMYDTFKGMTQPTSNDYENSTGRKALDEYERQNEINHNNWCYSSFDDVKNNIEPYKQNLTVNMIKGDIVETLKDNSNVPSSISVLRLDTDWYESTKVELEKLYPKLSSGGVLLIDDYGHWGGCKKAVDEFFTKLDKPPLLIPSDYTGRIAIKV